MAALSRGRDDRQWSRLAGSAVGFVLLGVLAGCGQGHVAVDLRSGSSPGVDRSEAGYSSLRPPAGQRKWPDTEFSTDAGRSLTAEGHALADFAVDALVAYFDRPNPADLAFDDVQARARDGESVLSSEDQVVTTAKQRDELLRARFAPSAVDGTLEALHINDERLIRRGEAYLSLGGGLSRALVSRVDGDLVGLYADPWTADVEIDPEGRVGSPVVRQSTWYFELRILRDPKGELVVDDFEMWPSEPAAYEAPDREPPSKTHLQGDPVGERPVRPSPPPSAAPPVTEPAAGIDPGRTTVTAAVPAR